MWLSEFEEIGTFYPNTPKFQGPALKYIFSDEVRRCVR